MFKRKETTSPEEKLLKIIEEPRKKKSEKTDRAFKQKRFPKIKLKIGLKKVNLLDLINRLLLGAGGVASIFLILTIFRPMERPSLGVVPREDINLLKSETVKVLKTDLGSYLDTILERNIFELIEPVAEFPASTKEVLNLKLVGIITLGKNKLQAIIEDKDARTYVANEGDVILEQMLVEKIESDKVIIKKGEEIIELK